MISAFGDIRKLFKIPTVNIDNVVFKLHYRLTVSLLVIFSILVNSSQYFGDPVDCTVNNEEIKNIVDTYCWFNSYNLVSDNGEVMVQVHKYRTEFNEGNDPRHDKQVLPYPKVSSDTKYKKVKQNFYQWIGLVLLIQAAFFYLPNFIWRNVWEENRVKEIISGLGQHIQDHDLFKIKEANVVEYMQENRGNHRYYAIKFFICELLNFVNVISQIFLTDWFLGHAFLNFGIQWLWYDPTDDQKEIYHPSHRYFPKETLCNVYWGSAGGSLQNRYQALCVFPIHVINEKIYLFLWFYFILLSLISGLSFMYRLATVFSPRLRLYMLKKRAWRVKEKTMKKLINTLDLGDWFILYQIGKNMDPFVFGKLLVKLSHELAGGGGGDSEAAGFYASAPVKYNNIENNDKYNEAFGQELLP